jgi:predicted nucleic acid-binding Zn ribbon protein
MPTYSSYCHECGTDHEYFRKMADALDTPECCGVKTEKNLNAMPQISAMAFTGHKGFHAMDGKNGGKGTWIETGADYKRYIKDNNKLVGDEGIQEAEHQRKNIQAADKKARRAAVVKAVEQHQT